MQRVETELEDARAVVGCLGLANADSWSDLYWLTTKHLMLHRSRRHRLTGSWHQCRSNHATVERQRGSMYMRTSPLPLKPTRCCCGASTAAAARSTSGRWRSISSARHSSCSGDTPAAANTGERRLTKHTPGSAEPSLSCSSPRQSRRARGGVGCALPGGGGGGSGEGAGRTGCASMAGDKRSAAEMWAVEEASSEDGRVAGTRRVRGAAPLCCLLASVGAAGVGVGGGRGIARRPGTCCRTRACSPLSPCTSPQATPMLRLLLWLCSQLTQARVPAALLSERPLPGALLPCATHAGRARVPVQRSVLVAAPRCCCWRARSSAAGRRAATRRTRRCFAGFYAARRHASRGRGSACSGRARLRCGAPVIQLRRAPHTALALTRRRPSSLLLVLTLLVHHRCFHRLAPTRSHSAPPSRSPAHAASLAAAQPASSRVARLALRRRRRRRTFS
jgi:hypothetical protein